jgi:hypothetical protein
MNQLSEVAAQRPAAARQTERPVTSHQTVRTLAPTIYCPPQRVEQCVHEAMEARRAP